MAHSITRSRCLYLSVDSTCRSRPHNRSFRVRTLVCSHRKTRSYRCSEESPNVDSAAHRHGHANPEGGLGSGRRLIDGEESADKQEDTDIEPDPPRIGSRVFLFVCIAVSHDERRSVVVGRDRSAGSRVGSCRHCSLVSAPVLVGRPLAVAGELVDWRGRLVAGGHLLQRHLVVFEILLADDDDRLGVDRVGVPHLRAEAPVGNVALDDVTAFAEVTGDIGRDRAGVADAQHVVVRRRRLLRPDAGTLTEQLQGSVAGRDPDGGGGLPTKALDEVIVAAAAEDRPRDLTRRVETLEDDARVVVQPAGGFQRHVAELPNAEIVGGAEDSFEIGNSVGNAVGLGEIDEIIEVVSTQQVVERCRLIDGETGLFQQPVVLLVVDLCGFVDRADRGLGVDRGVEGL